MPDDKIKREIEDILNRLDEFVPEESAASRMRRRSSGVALAIVRALLAPLAAISIRQVMLTALVIIVIGFLGMRIHPIYGRWLLVGGIILFLTSFALSFVHRGSSPPEIEKRWRGRPMELRAQPPLAERIRDWLKSLRRPRY